MYRGRGAAVLVEALVEQGALEQAAQALEPLDAELLADTTIAAPLRVPAADAARAAPARGGARRFLGAGAVAERTR